MARRGKSFEFKRSLFAVILLSGLALAAPSAQGQALTLSDDLSSGETSANEGYLTIAWQAGSGPYTLTQTGGTTTGEPIELYSGPSTSYFMTGLLEGNNTFQVADSTGETVDLSVSVDYPIMALVFASLGTGAVLLVALIGIVVVGSRRTAEANIG